MQDKWDEPDLKLVVFLRNAYNHPDFSDEQENADVEKGPEEEDIIQENDTTALHDSLSARSVDEFVERDGSKVDRDSSPLLKDNENQDSPLLNPSESLRRRLSSNSGTSLIIKEDNVEVRDRDTLGGCYSARSHFDSVSSHSILEGGSVPSDTDSSSSSAAGKATTVGDDSNNELLSLQLYLQGQLSRQGSFFDSLRSSDETARLASLPTNSWELKNDADAAALRDLQLYVRKQMSRVNSAAGEPIEDDIGEDALRTAYLQGYLRGQLSGENSSPEPSPLIFRKSFHKDDNEKKDGVNLAGSPFRFRRGVLYESDVDDSDEIISVSYLQGYVKGQLSRENSPAPSFTDSPGSPLTFRTGRFGQYVDSGESQDIRTSPLRGASPLNPRVPKAQTMSTIRESSEMLSDAHLSRANTFAAPFSSLRSKERETLLRRQRSSWHLWQRFLNLHIPVRGRWVY